MSPWIFYGIFRGKNARKTAFRNIQLSGANNTAKDVIFDEFQDRNDLFYFIL